MPRCKAPEILRSEVLKGTAVLLRTAMTKDLP
jgi:hypothetical protein